MAIEIKEFDTMVNDVLVRIVNSTNISNTNPGSVIRTIVEALMAEQDIQYYQIDQIFNSMDIDSATGDDLDRLIKILGVVRKSAVKCITNIEFGRTEAYASDISIPVGSTVSTRMNADGTVTEFVVTQEDAKLVAGDTSVLVECTTQIAGSVYIPANTVIIMNSPILNIEYVNNNNSIYGGLDEESDYELRERAKNVLSLLGKGTTLSLESSVMGIDGVQDVICIDMARGVGTADLIVVTSTIPPSQTLQTDIENAISDNKAAGINVQVVYPTVVTVNISINTTVPIDAGIIGSGILGYISLLGVGDDVIINQLERYVLNACDSTGIDVEVVTPSSNISVGATEIARSGVITINGVEWNG